jgi:hypothetical protein
VRSVTRTGGPTTIPRADLPFAPALWSCPRGHDERLLPDEVAHGPVPVGDHAHASDEPQASEPSRQPLLLRGAACDEPRGHDGRGRPVLRPAEAGVPPSTVSAPGSRPSRSAWWPGTPRAPHRPRLDAHHARAQPPPRTSPAGRPDDAGTRQPSPAQPAPCGRRPAPPPPRVTRRPMTDATHADRHHGRHPSAGGGVPYAPSSSGRELPWSRPGEPSRPAPSRLASVAARLTRCWGQRKLTGDGPATRECHDRDVRTEAAHRATAGDPR